MGVGGGSGRGFFRWYRFVSYGKVDRGIFVGVMAGFGLGRGVLLWVVRVWGFGFYFVRVIIKGVRKLGLCFRGNRKIAVGKTEGDRERLDGGIAGI